ncbi:KINESIN-LIKE PROTEIN IN ARABIDOPSIS THALIANA D, kinesin 4 [Hibiscus trionum]|uniref:KINESIN-LIKE PROTEIN IN ARABIDOPSIS THALIANA D, kinesin 4 n=1 Tax=Hibiscus trionum TaxID=183268 RepID=A0A9W7JEN7_HIBTR|nr:KINESIN-LIKE PROTEIN IN ARABIDOPSIS THALIANA D, kinesin 4 [Hibiscus trionum]
MATDSTLQSSLKSVFEDVLQEKKSRTSAVNLDSRKFDEASLKRNEAAGWLRKTIGVVGGKDLPAEPSEEEFRYALRSGIILCNAINKIKPGSVPKVVEGPCDSVTVPDGAALSAFQYFENVRNFLVAIEEMGIPTFEASDLEQGGKSSRLVTCVLALKSYSEWKQNGGIGSWKYSANSKPSCFGTRKTSEPFTNSVPTTLPSDLSSEQSDSTEEGNVGSFGTLVRAALLDKRQDEIPMIVESVINKVSEEFDRRLATYNELVKISAKAKEESVTDDSLSRTASCDEKIKNSAKAKEESVTVNSHSRTASCDEKIKNCAKAKEESVTVNSHSRTASCDGKVGVVEVKASADEMVEDESSSIGSERKETCDDKSDAHEELVQYVLKQQAMVERQRQFIKELKHCLYSTKAGMQALQMTYKEEVFNLGKHLLSLANAASGYQRVLEENRKLYNQVQDLKGNIRVYCRVRPLVPGHSNTLSSVDHIDERTITILSHSKNGKEAKKSFTFNKIFGPSVTQAEVFSDTQPLIRSVLDGYNVCIFAYGQTGSGKTHTMTGPKELTEEGLGVNYRALSDLFHLSKERKETISYEISVQMLEIYNEQVKDLLSSDEIRNSSQNGINVPDANLVRVSSPSDVINLMDLGHRNRSVCSTALNDRSSRSHSCLTVHVQGKDLTSGNILRGSMHLVDLAGSERVDKSEVTGDRLKEAQHINKSLSALGDVISSLASRSSHVPFRNSKLTQLLQDSLGGQAKTLMFVHIAPEYEAHGETLSTLKFAERVATVELGAAKVNKDSGEVKELKEQIASLKAALARKEGDHENLQHTPSISDSPEQNILNLGSSPSHSKWKSSSDLSCITASTEYESSASRRDSLETPNPSHWPPLGSPNASSVSRDDDRDSEASGDWEDKVMVNKQDNIKKDKNPSARPSKGVSNGKKLPDKPYQSQIPDPTKIHTEQSFNKSTTIKKGNQDYDLQRTRSEVSYNDDSDHETVTSDCLETDSFSSGIPKISSSPNMLAFKPKKQQPKPAAKATEIRSSIPSLIPSPSARKPSTAVTPSSQKGKRKTGINK